MTKQPSPRFSAEDKEQSVARLGEPGTTPVGVATGLVVTATQFKDMAARSGS